MTLRKLPMKHSIRHTIATGIAGTAFLLAATLRAETLHAGHVYKTTADAIIAERHLVCAYGPWVQETIRGGATVISRVKVCS